MKTLIADDERPVRIAISKLGQWGKYHLEQPVQVENGQEALLAMYELKPSIVFVDIQMPVMNGLDFLEKASVEFPGTVYIIVSGYDEFSIRAYPDYPGGTSEQRELRERLRIVMEGDGFKIFHNEWWHFDYREWKKYPIMNLRFDEI